MDEDDSVDGRSAAEDYRIQRQSADARINGFEAMTPEVFMAWTEQNRAKLLAIARTNGTEESDVEKVVEEYLNLLRNLPPGGPFDDLNITLILANVVKRIETICNAGKFQLARESLMA